MQSSWVLALLHDQAQMPVQELWLRSYPGGDGYHRIILTSRVAPLKVYPTWVELMGALLALGEGSQGKSRSSVQPEPFLWTDSQVTLHWIEVRKPQMGKPFVVLREQGSRKSQSYTDPYFILVPLFLWDIGSRSTYGKESAWFCSYNPTQVVEWILVFLRQIDFQTKTR
ncbi:hypothetical protein TNCV_798121 [Trichonephila clavipes]|nr:hypothetical protein TNCV_798121 [Trichonephila clavipes]